jgi:hypothetical protein
MMRVQNCGDEVGPLKLCCYGALLDMNRNVFLFSIYLTGRRLSGAYLDTWRFGRPIVNQLPVLKIRSGVDLFRKCLAIACWRRNDALDFELHVE